MTTASIGTSGYKPDGQTLNFIVHKGDEKDPGPDMSLALDEKREVWLISGNATLYAEQPSDEEVTAPAGDLTKAQAHWLRRGTLALDTSNLGEERAVFTRICARCRVGLGKFRSERDF